MNKKNTLVTEKDIDKFLDDNKDLMDKLAKHDVGPRGHLIMSETSSSTWNYHLRLVQNGEEKYSGGAGSALCGKPLGWDVKIPLNTYGMKDHMSSKYCAECLRIAREANLEGVEEIK